MADQQTAIFLNDKMLARANTSDLTQVDGNWYFKEAALIDRGRYTESNTHTTCSHKGEASYFNYEADDGKVIEDIAWFYPKPKGLKDQVEGRVAFYVRKIPGLRVDVPPVDA